MRGVASNFHERSADPQRVGIGPGEGASKGGRVAKREAGSGVRMMASYRLIAAFAVFVAATAVWEHRYEYQLAPGGGYMFRINRITGSICAFPTDLEWQTLLALKGYIPLCNR